MTDGMKTLNALAALGAVLVAAAPAHAAPSPDWKAFARCAAAYRVNAATDAGSRAPSMIAMVSETAQEYEAAALRRLDRREAGQDGKRTIAAYVGEQQRDLAKLPRTDVEHLIDACPQPD